MYYLIHNVYIQQFTTDFHLRLLQPIRNAYNDFRYMWTILIYKYACICTNHCTFIEMSIKKTQVNF